jgi:hypothetical protein
MSDHSTQDRGSFRDPPAQPIVKPESTLLAEESYCLPWGDMAGLISGGILHGYGIYVGDVKRKMCIRLPEKAGASRDGG